MSLLRERKNLENSWQTCEFKFIHEVSIRNSMFCSLIKTEEDEYELDAATQFLPEETPCIEPIKSEK